MLWKYLKLGKAISRNPERSGRENLNTEQSENLRKDKMISSERIQIERKQFFFDFKENAGGRFLRITEDVGGHRDTIIVPATGLQLFRESLDHIIAVDGKTGSS